MSLTVVIRNRNEAAHLSQVLRALKAQTREASVVLVDNDSTDDSRDIARTHGALIVPISSMEFTYGRALNLGIRAADAEIIVILSAHSLPIGRHFLEDIEAEFFQYPDLAAIRCLHVGKAWEVRLWTEPQVLQGPSVLEKVVSQGPLASGCALRKSVWRDIPFDERIEAAEEKLWAFQVLQKGYTIRRCSAAYLYLRTRGAFEMERVSAREHLALYRIGGNSRRPSLKRLLYGVCIDAPKAAAATALRAVLRFAYAATTSLRARKLTPVRYGKSGLMEYERPHSRCSTNRRPLSS